MIPIYDAAATPLEEILPRRRERRREIAGAVSAILDAVETEGDAALRRYAKEFDHADLGDIEVRPEELEAAVRALDPALREILEEAAARIRSFHRRQLRQGFVIAEEEGVVLGQRVTPLERVGLYIPGGTAAYPSSVLMNAVPAKLAGCGQVMMVSPPSADGEIHPVILAAAAIAGVDRVFRVGGAQAVAALAFGTESVPQVDKIVGPGNAYVAEAKRQVFGQVAIDMIAGPSEILVIADGGSDPVHLAADLLSQAEHDRMASAVLITDSPGLAQAVARELERQLPLLPRAEIARTSLLENGRLLVAASLRDAVELSNRIAPEHLELCLERPFDYLSQVRHAGSVFLGRHCPEALGDYFAGPNHTLPTGGMARFMSPLSVEDFVKTSQFTYCTPQALGRFGAKVARFARQEGLEAHARSVESRLIRREEERP